MAGERKESGLWITERERATVTGVLEVISFDEESICMDTEEGTLWLRGSDIHVDRLNLEEGEIVLRGSFSTAEYGERESVKKQGILFGLFR